MRLLAVLLLSGLLVACAKGEAATPVSGDEGIVSINPCSDQMLEALDANDDIIAVSQWSQDPRSASASPDWARRFPATTGRAEELVLRRPGLVLSGGLMPPQTRAIMDRAGISVLDFPVPTSVDESLEQISVVGHAIGRERAADQLIARIDTAIARSAARGGQGRRALVLTGEALTGQNTLIGDMLVRMGYRNAAADYGVANLDNLRLERLIADPPDVIFASARTKLLDHPALGALEGRVTKRDFPPRLSWCAGPTMIALAHSLEWPQ